MTRRVTPSNERIMFPAWSAEVEYSESYVPIRQRRKQNRRVAIGVVVTISVLYLFFQIRIARRGTDSALGGTLSERDLHDLHLKSIPHAKIPQGNPWRGAGRRRRRDLLIAVSGCGGTFRPAIALGVTATLRYAVRSTDGLLLDSSRDPSDVLIGSGQLHRDVEHGLVGLCQGEAARFITRDKRKVLVFVERIGPLVLDEQAEDDRLATLVIPTAGRKGKSCISTCSRKGMACSEKGFRVVNNCPRLSQVFDCIRCEVAAAGSGGPDMPAYVSKAAPVGHARGACLVSPRVSMSSCGARYKFTKRLCPCLTSPSVAKLPQS